VVVVLIDFDGTLAARNTPAYIARFNSRLKLGIEQERLTDLSYRAFLDLPEVCAFRNRHGEKKFDFVLKALALEPDYLRELLPIDDALTGVQALAQRFSLSYCSARKINFTASLDQRIEQASVDWLYNNQFPYAESCNVYLCNSPFEKLLHCIEVAQKSAQHVVLVDDLYETLIQNALTLDAPLRAQLRTNCSLVAVWAQDLSWLSPDQCPFKQVLALPRWSRISSVIDPLISLGIFERIHTDEESTTERG
jgi:5'(3')-deoxyribonucleotidase